MDNEKISYLWILVIAQETRSGLLNEIIHVYQTDRLQSNDSALLFCFALIHFTLGRHLMSDLFYV